ncbi:MAG: NAD-dependent epimerase/dehydratase family protein [Chloroflexi bacterium]|nr:MAG: NAD-dependent epimerase/dehydratase family protein [Chloroflexota bacterium]
MRVVVTGGAGFLGSHIVDALLAQGDDVVVVDDLSTGDRANLDPRADLRIADISDLSALQRELGTHRVDAVVHCAAKTKVVESMAKPELYERVIVGGTRNVLETTRRLGARVVVNISTGGAIYGETPVCADENVPVDPQSNYGRFKAAAEKLVESSDLRAVTLRLANIYGPRQRTDLEGGVIAIFLGCWKRGEPLTMFGDGSYERDYVYIADVVEAVTTALGGTHAGTFNIGTGIATSVKQLLSSLSAILGPPPSIRAAPARPAEVLRACVNPTKAAREGLWHPKTALLEGLRLTAAAEGVLLS